MPRNHQTCIICGFKGEKEDFSRFKTDHCWVCDDTLSEVQLRPFDPPAHGGSLGSRDVMARMKREGRK